MNTTDWRPTGVDGDAPKFLSLVVALERDILAGRLQGGARLPPYRDLATSLGVSPGTVSKAYVEAKRRGLVLGEVGRGTFVREALAAATPDASPPNAHADEGTLSAIIDISTNTPPMLSHNIVLAEAFASLSRQSDLDLYSRYLPYFSHPQHREAAVAWLGQHGLAAGPDEVVLTNGAQHAMAVAMSSIAKAKDIVFTETLTYPGMKSLASYLGLTLEAVDGDGEGMLPERLDKAVRRRPGKAVYLMPTLHNPTGRTMGLERRRAIAEVASRHGLFVVEDDIYGLLHQAPGAPPHIRDLAPESTFYMTSMSKAVIPGLRIGFLVPPKRKLSQVVDSMRATGWTAAPLMVDVAARLILDGTAARLAEQNRHEALRRQQLAHQVLGAQLPGEAVPCYHAWLEMPEGLATEDFIAAARNAAVIVTPTEGVSVGTGDPGGVRLCLGAARSSHILETALKRLEAILLGDRRPAFVGLV